MYLRQFNSTGQNQVHLVMSPLSSCNEILPWHGNHHMMASSLVRYRQNVPWTRKQRRTFHRILSGVTRARNMGERLRVLTLTSAPDSPGGNLLSQNFQVLRKSVARKFGYRLEYCRVRTDEGFGVLHVVYRAGKKGFLPHSWLKREWNRIHGAKIVYIQELRGNNKRIARYLVANYVAGHHSFMRQSWSWNWCFRGFVRLWGRVKRGRSDLNTAIVEWNILLRTRNPYKHWKTNRHKKRWKEGIVILPLTRYL